MRNITPQLLTELSQTGEAHGLTRAEQEWLVAAVAGCVRPNRDKPVWDLCQLVRRLGAAADIDEVVAILLGNGTAGPGSMHRRLCAFGDFLLTRLECAHFAQVRADLAPLCGPAAEDAVAKAVSSLSSQLRQFRRTHLPLEGAEAIFREVLDDLRALGGDLARASDATVLRLWQRRANSGRTVEFRTCVDHVLIFQKAFATLAETAALTDAQDVTEAHGVSSETRLDVAPDPLGIHDLPRSPKVLTETERATMADLTRLAPLVAANILTICRYISFGEVQSGISNHLRRGGGGAPVAERATCSDAMTYEELAEKLSAIHTTLENVLRYIAPALLDKMMDDIRSRPLPAATRPRRAGFEADVADVAKALAPFTGLLVDAMALLASCDISGRVPAQQFAEDRTVFSAAFHALYVERAHRQEEPRNG